MVQVQELMSTDTAPRAMPPGFLTPLPWPGWTLRVRSLDVDGVRADYVEMSPYDIVVPAVEDRPGLPVRTMLVVVLDGVSHGRIEGERLILAPGQAALIDGRAAMSFHCPAPIRAVRLFVEHSELPDDALLGAETPCVRLRHTPLVTGCIGLIRGLLQVGSEDLEPRDEQVVGQPLVALLTGMLREAGRDRDAAAAVRAPRPTQERQHRRALIERYVEEHLADRDLRVGRIAAALDVTVRTVHAAFEDQGVTAAAYVRARRVARAQTLLALRSEPPNVAALAERVGMTRDQLTRAFQDDTGLTARQWWERERRSGLG